MFEDFINQSVSSVKQGNYDVPHFLTEAVQHNVT